MLRLLAYVEYHFYKHLIVFCICIFNWFVKLTELNQYEKQFWMSFNCFERCLMDKIWFDNLEMGEITTHRELSKISCWIFNHQLPEKLGNHWPIFLEKHIKGKDEMSRRSFVFSFTAERYFLLLPRRWGPNSEMFTQAVYKYAICLNAFKQCFSAFIRQKCCALMEVPCLTLVDSTNLHFNQLCSPNELHRLTTRQNWGGINFKKQTKTWEKQPVKKWLSEPTLANCEVTVCFQHHHSSTNY